MLPDMERIIASINQRDQDTVLLLLESYNNQYAECFFFNTETHERRKLTGNVEEQWKRFKQRFSLYITAIGAADKSGKQKGALFLTVAGSDAIDVFSSLQLTADQQADYNKVLEEFEKFCTPKRNETYERYIFHSRCQAEPETIEEFIMDLKLKSQSCNFGQLTDSLIRDCIIIGVRDKSFRERLLGEGDLTLERIIQICQAKEATQSQIKTMNSDKANNKDYNVEAVVRGKLNPSAAETERGRTRQSKGGREPCTSNREPHRCDSCGGQHPPRQCPAYGKECRACGRRNRFAQACKQAKQRGAIHSIEDDSCGSTETGDLFIGTVGAETCDEDWIASYEDLATALVGFISSPLQPSVLRVCLHTLRILSRDRRALGPMVTDSALFTLAHLGGISLLPACPQQTNEKTKDEAARSHSQTERRAADGCEEAANPDVLSVSSAATLLVPHQVAGGSATNDPVNCDYTWKGDGGGVVLARGKKENHEGNSVEEEKEDDEEMCKKEAIKVMCNIIYNSSYAQERSSALRLLQGLWESLKQGLWCTTPPSDQFYKLRLLFLLTALRPELRLQLQQEHGVSVLTNALEQYLVVRWHESYVVLTDITALPISKEKTREVIEILKTLFNMSCTFHRQEPDEEEAALYRHLAAVLGHCLLMSCDEEDTLEELQGHTINVLSALPLTCLDVLLSDYVDQASHKWEGVNMDCVQSLLQFMERRLNRGQKLKEKLIPVLNLLTESSRAHRETRRYLRHKILPPLRDVAIRPEQDSALRGQLVRLMTHVDTDVKHCAAELLFVLCKESVSRFVKYTGYGNAAGLLAARGLLAGRRNSVDSHASQYSSDSDSDTEEYKEAKAKINLVTGRVEAEQPDPMEDMTEEEKELEARRLISMINRLSEDRIIQPAGVTREGRLAPLWTQMTDCTMEEEESEEEDMDLIPATRKNKPMD
ncbi:chaperone Ric-8A [Pholidichthys leucotaenia]